MVQQGKQGFLNSGQRQLNTAQSLQNRPAPAITSRRLLISGQRLQSQADACLSQASACLLQKKNSLNLSMTIDMSKG